MPKAKESKDYQTLRRELDDVLAALQAPDINVDEAVKLYERGLALTAQLREHLAEVENKLERLKLQTPAA